MTAATAAVGAAPATAMETASTAAAVETAAATRAAEAAASAGPTSEGRSGTGSAPAGRSGAKTATTVGWSRAKTATTVGWSGAIGWHGTGAAVAAGRRTRTIPGASPVCGVGPVIWLGLRTSEPAAAKLTATLRGSRAKVPSIPEAGVSPVHAACGRSISCAPESPMSAKVAAESVRQPLVRVPNS
jgi:hypothetical protein